MCIAATWTAGKSSAIYKPDRSIADRGLCLGCAPRRIHSLPRPLSTWSQPRRAGRHEEPSRRGSCPTCAKARSFRRFPVSGRAPAPRCDKSQFPELIDRPAPPRHEGRTVREAGHGREGCTHLPSPRLRLGLFTTLDTGQAATDSTSCPSCGLPITITRDLAHGGYRHSNVTVLVPSSLGSRKRNPATKAISAPPRIWLRATISRC